VLAPVGPAAPAIAAPAEQQPPAEKCAYNNPNLPRFPKSAEVDAPWPQQRLGYTDAHKYSIGQGILVAVIDSGVQADTAQLRGRVFSGIDLTPASPRPGANVDCFGHGTAVTGIIGAAPKADVGFVGVAPGVRILPIRQTWGIDVQGRSVLGQPGKLIQAMYAAVNNGAKVMNISITVPAAPLTEPTRRAFVSAVEYARSHNVVIVAAAGNSSENDNQQVLDTYPAALAARYDNVIAVGGIAQDGQLYKESVYGTTPWVTVVAPAEDVVTTFINKGAVGSLLQYAQGTSFAAPFVTGTVALLQSRFPGISAGDVKQRIERTADHPATNLPDLRMGYGVIDPVAALTTVVPPRAAPASPRVSAPLPPPARPDNGTRNAAIGAAGIGTIAAVLLVGAAVIIPRGRRRKWQPGRRAPVEP
jgi:membrane-anchored mycosin MYCP